MTFTDLHSFIVVYQLRSVSDAAVELNITQSALSKRLQALQTELNSTLISTRNKRRLVITESGEVFFRYAQTLMTQYGLLQDELQAYRDLRRGTLHIGSVPVMAQYGLTAKLSQFMQTYPQINLRLDELEGADLLAQLQDHQIDLAILLDVQTRQLNRSQFESRDLLTDDLRVILPATHPLARQETVRILDLQDVDLVTLSPGSGVYEQLDTLFQRAGITPNIRFSTPHIETLLGMIAHTQWVTCLYAQAAAPFLSADFVTRPLLPTQISRLQLVAPRGQRAPAVTRLLEALTH
ncbi:LysR family transcriptional regulator [Levilactobacillus suantsaii]|uniref:LysR family transcriptional regulator n=1 Tax=Levilactobacillus suantsaii TaxID=2292255 RepID=A0A4Q0VGV6_9LACO|nr:LysR substrate-binding domain-containing protein [Levilactobacillus suantsaii]QMU09049.1 LysR family transcriptional regulator [Levilactobacillus suantsaii]RXI78283.1 LysR family transcriptional regulator [Levilactobacillus suantsaii]